MKKAVVTFIKDKNDFLYPPVFDFAGVDFLCFTDITDIRTKFWKIRPFKGLSIEEIKSDKEKYLSEYEQVEFVEEGAEAVITMGADGDIRIVNRPDITGCVDAGYLREVRNAACMVQLHKEAEDALKFTLKADSDDENQYPLKLTIGMLVGTKSPYFDQCFACIQNIMEAVPASELIIVDTGNEDGSVDKLREASADGMNITIVPFTWVHDFSAARNEAIRRARGLWYMTLDDDEWFGDISALVEFFESDRELYKKYDYAMYTQRNYMDESGKSFEDASVVRLARNRSDLQYNRRIHENFNFKEDEIDPYAINSYVHHYGYLNNLESRKLKSQRNMALLLIENEENPADSHIIAQIIQEMLFTERYELAYVYALRGLALQRLEPDFHMAMFVAMLVKILMAINRDELWIYENRYVKNAELNYIESAYVTYKYGEAAYERAEALSKRYNAEKEALKCDDDMKKLRTEIVKYADKTIEYSIYFEKAYFDYNRAPVDVQLAVAATICDNLCRYEGYLSDALMLRALAYELKSDEKAIKASVKKISPYKLNGYIMEYYSMLVRYDIVTSDFYDANADAPGIWLLFVQALLQKPAFCAKLLKRITTPALDLLVTDAQVYINSVQKPVFDRIFEGLAVLRLVCEYMELQDYSMALNALKIAMQSSEQVKAVALILFEELKMLTK